MAKTSTTTRTTIWLPSQTGPGASVPGLFYFMNKIQRIAATLGIPAEEITKAERKAIAKTKDPAEVCRILCVEVDGNVQYVRKAMKRPKKVVYYAYAA